MSLSLKQRETLLDELEQLHRSESYIRFWMKGSTDKTEWQEKLKVNRDRQTEIGQTLWPQKFDVFNRVMASIQNPQLV